MAPRGVPDRPTRAASATVVRTLREWHRVCSIGFHVGVRPIHELLGLPPTALRFTSPGDEREQLERIAHGYTPKETDEGAIDPPAASFDATPRRHQPPTNFRSFDGAISGTGRFETRRRRAACRPRIDLAKLFREEVEKKWRSSPCDEEIGSFDLSLPRQRA
jgi:hypothetical protein